MRRLPRLIVPAVVAVLASSCTGGGDPAPSASPSSPSPTSAPLASDVGDVTFVPGSYSYEFNGMVATLKLAESTGTLDVRNGSGATLGKPGLYVIAGDGKRYEGSVASPATIADGDHASFEVTFPDEVTPRTVGLAILLFGGSNVGAMAPVPA